MERLANIGQAEITGQSIGPETGINPDGRTPSTHPLRSDRIRADGISEQTWEAMMRCHEIYTGIEIAWAVEELEYADIEPGYNGPPSSTISGYYSLSEENRKYRDEMMEGMEVE